MSEIYTVQKWIDQEELPIEADEIKLNDPLRSLAHLGRLSFEDLHEIYELQKWTYHESLRLNVKAYLRECIADIRVSDFPEQALELQIEEYSKRIEEMVEEKENVVRGLYQYKGIEGGDYKYVKNISTNGSWAIASFFIYKENGKSLANKNHECATWMYLKRELEKLDLKKLENKKGIGGRPKISISKEFLDTQIKDYVSRFIKSKKYFHSDSRINISQFSKYVADNNNWLSGKEKTIERRFIEYFDKDKRYLSGQN